MYSNEVRQTILEQVQSNDNVDYIFVAERDYSGDVHGGPAPTQPLFTELVDLLTKFNPDISALCLYVIKSKISFQTVTIRDYYYSEDYSVWSLPVWEVREAVLAFHPDTIWGENK